MANLKDIKKRRGSVQVTMQVTRAMQMIASTNLRKAQDRLIRSGDYLYALEKVLGDVSSESPRRSSKIDPKCKELVIVLSSGRGLCGVFNSNVFKKVQQHLSETSSETSLVTIGKKGNMFFSTKSVAPILEDFGGVLDDLSFYRSGKVFDFLSDTFYRGHFSKVYIVYTHFMSLSRQEVRMLDLFPFKMLDSDTSIDLICEPNREALVNFTIPKLLHAKLYDTMSHSITSEHVSRMVAMQKATENADQLSAELSLMYNKLRQASVTNEILEIISGAKASGS